MSWWAVGAAAVSAVGSASAAGKSNKAAAKESIAQNEAIIKANVANTIRTGYRAGILNMQKGLTRRLEAQKGFENTAKAALASGAVSANQAASGTIGASVDAVSNDIDMKLGEAQAADREEHEINVENFNIQLQELINQGQASIQSPFKVKMQSDSDIMGNALLAGATTFGSMYAKSKFDLGLGESTSAGRSMASSGSVSTGVLGSGTSSAGSSFGAGVGGGTQSYAKLGGLW
jgi:hypothetical protein